MAGRTCIDLAQSLFPLAVVTEVAGRKDLSTTVERLYAVDSRAVTVQIGGQPPDTERFLNAVTEAALDYWATREEHFPFFAPERPARRILVTLRLTDGDEGAQVTVSASLATHSPSGLMRTLGSLRHMVRVTIDSVNPVDQLVVTLTVKPGVPMHAVVGELVRQVEMAGGAATR